MNDNLMIIHVDDEDKFLYVEIPKAAVQLRGIPCIIYWDVNSQKP